jgi:micrococcal nuclease
MKNLTQCLRVLALVAGCTHAYAAEVAIEYVKAYDGDTITVNLPGLKKLDKAGSYSLFWDGISVRLGGIDTPEIKGECDKEKEFAQKAKTFVHNKLKSARKLTLDNMDKDKYFRILGEIFVDGISLSQMLIDEGYAIPYDGGIKENVWCKDASAKKTKRPKPH